MGRFDKLALRFPFNFWAPNFTGQILRNTLQTSQFTIWFNPAPMLNKPILVPVVFADFAKTLETVPNNKVVSMLMDILKPWFAAQNPPIQVPDPIQRGFQRTSWGSDPFAFGSVSHIPPGATPIDYDIMSLAVPFSLVPSPSQRLFFAGEATHREHPSSVWGAYESGLREACRISLISPPGDPPNPSRVASKRRSLSGKVSPASIWRAYNAGLKEAYRIAARDEMLSK